MLDNEIIAVLSNIQTKMQYMSGYSIQEILGRVKNVKSDIEEVFTELKKPFYYVCKVYMNISAMYKSGSVLKPLTGQIHYHYYECHNHQLQRSCNYQYQFRPLNS